MADKKKLQLEGKSILDVYFTKINVQGKYVYEKSLNETSSKVNSHCRKHGQNR